MSLFDKFTALANLRSELQQLDLHPFGAEIEQLFSATEGQVEGRRVILAGTNNYLGLTFHPDCIAAAQAAVARYGTGTTGSRMANGSYTEHRLLEQELAAFFDREHAITFSTGYAATMGLSATLAGPGDTILLDADSHASIYDGVRLSGADIIRFAHNDPADLDKRLCRLGERARNSLVIIEGIYSMQGDTAPVAEIAAVKNRYGAMLMVDEAHSLGVLGERGRGAAEACGAESEVDFIAGTFSKSLGAVGGFCVSPHAELETLRYAMRSYIFTASPSPSVVASTRAALQILRKEPGLREKLWNNATRLYQGLQGLGLKVGPQVSPVVAVTVEDKQQALAWWHQLLDTGIYVNLVIPPASPGQHALLRCSVSAAHTTQQIEAIVNAFSEIMSSQGKSLRASAS